LKNIEKTSIKNTVNKRNLEDTNWPHLPCFDIPDLSLIKCDGTMQFKKDTFFVYGDMEWTVEGEWLNGLPHGICIIES
jgi:hypothetical protein